MPKTVIEKKSDAEWSAREQELRELGHDALAAIVVKLERHEEWAKSEGPLRKMTNAVDAAGMRNGTIAFLAASLSRAHAELRDLRSALKHVRAETGRWKARALLSEKLEEETQQALADLQRRLISEQTPKPAAPVSLVGPHASRSA
jgi:hypothetical protein